MQLDVIITGSTGMVGKGVMLECLDSPEVRSITVVNRQTLDLEHPKLKEILVKDFQEISNLDLGPFDGCFYCLGVSALGLSEQQYTAITHDITINFATHILKSSPQITFCFVSGAGTNAKSNTMWARVKGQTELDLKAMPFKKVYLFRPGFIQPLRGIKSRTSWYNYIYFILKPLLPILKSIFRTSITDTTAVGKAMIGCLSKGYRKEILTNADINILAQQ